MRIYEASGMKSKRAVLAYSDVLFISLNKVDSHFTDTEYDFHIS